MNRKIEAYQKIISLVESGHRIQYKYSQIKLVRNGLVECMCALGCMMSEQARASLRYDGLSHNSCAIDRMTESKALNALFAYGFNIHELSHIQRLNDSLTYDDEFIDEIYNLIQKEKGESDGR